jgi:hypothetical protein
MRKEYSPKIQALTDEFRKNPNGAIWLAIMAKMESRKCPECRKLVRLKMDGSFRKHKCTGI